MTRTVRSRRAERPHQPLYARALRLRHLAPSGLLCFVFLEGAVVLGILLALAELVSWWGVVVLPITVALMVKFNDLVAGAMTPHSVSGATASARASVIRPAVMGQDSGAGSSEAAPWFVTPDAEPGALRSTAGPHGGFPPAGFGPAVASLAERGHPGVPSYQDRAADGEWAPGGAGYAPVVSHESSAVGYGPDVPAVGYPGSYSRGLSGNAYPARSYDGAAGYPARSPVEPAVEEQRGSNAPVRRAWTDPLDAHQQMARQAASRRYE